MQLKRLEILGFKTFAQKTEIHFNSGITAVVGPNGSGKSNVSDAITWVLGENNVRQLRGSAATDVIFAGNEKRRPLGMAEVSLTIDNSSRRLPLEFSEITVTRKMYRNGEGEYFINKVPCRLKDIYELFLDTGVGRDAYALINQGEIDQILSVRAEDRRAIFEEAAGIKKYRVRKREAERKLEQTQQNLLRLADILGELESNLGPLARQAQSARRYRELSGRLRALENAWYGMRLRRLNGEKEGLEQLLRELAEEKERLEAEAAGAQAQQLAARKALEELDQHLDRARADESAALREQGQAEAERARAEERTASAERQLRGLEREIDDQERRRGDLETRLAAAEAERDQLAADLTARREELGRTQAQARAANEAYVAAARERERQRQAALEAERRRAEAERKRTERESAVARIEQRERSLAQTLQRLEVELEEACAEHGRLNADASTAGEEIAALTRQEAELARTLEAGQRELTTLRAEARRAQEAAEAARREWSSASARLEALSEMAGGAADGAEGARQLLESARAGKAPGGWRRVLDGLRVPQDWEAGVEAALGPYADALVADTAEHFEAGLAWLRQRKLSAILFPPSVEVPPTAGTLAETIPANPDGGAAATVARALLTCAVPCDSLDVARVQAASCAATLWVTRTGEWVANAGGVCSGAGKKESPVALAMRRQREIERLKSETARLGGEAERLKGEAEAARQAAERQSTAHQEAERARDRVRSEAAASRREAERRRQDVLRALNRVERLEAQRVQAERDRAAAGRELETARKQLEEAAASAAQPDNATPAQPAVAASASNVEALESARRKADAAVSDLRVALASLEQRHRAADGGARRLADSLRGLERRVSELAREHERLEAERASRDGALTSLAQRASEAAALVAQARDRLADGSQFRAARAASLNEAAVTAQHVSARLRELMERSHRGEMERAAVETERSHLIAQWLDAATPVDQPEAEPPSIDELLTQWSPDEAAATLGRIADPEAELHRLRRQLRSLGAVNLDAEDEYAKQSERHQFLCKQKEDLEKAQEQLLEAIRDIDAASKETFLKAFHQIAEAFDVMFRRLFNGGRTELRLTDPNDVLETGVDIIVQPPGKKQQNLLLLSGGERALTACAMLFALLTVRPSPFCVMDEVDAPLDEGNVQRFGAMLREFSKETQFIVITHNRGTMEAADTLYGVTMEERGVSRVLSCTLDDPLLEQVEGAHPVGAAG